MDGSLDPTFGNAGSTTTSFDGANVGVIDMQIDEDGLILVAGGGFDPFPASIVAAARYHADGSLDLSFGNQGKMTAAFGGPNAALANVAAQVDGKILAVGVRDIFDIAAALSAFLVCRYSADGSPDTTFYGNGVSTIDVGDGTDSASSVLVQPDGQILVAGAATVGTHRGFALVRLQDAPPADLVSPHGFHFDVVAQGEGAGELIQASGAADGLGRLQVQGADYAPSGAIRVANNGRTILTAEQTLSGLAVHREITVPDTGSQDFANTVEVLENSTASPITVTVRIVGNLGSDAATTVWNTSDGDALVEITDQWIGTDDADGSGSPAVIHYIAGPDGVQPTSVAVTGDNIEWTYLVTVPAGQTVRVSHYTVLANTRAEAEAAAATLRAPGDTGLTAAGVYDPVESKFYLKFANAEGFADLTFAFGAPGWKPLAGDWDGDGRDTIGLFDPASAQFYLRNSNTSGTADVSFGYGDATQGAAYTLVMGDWNGDGIDTIGLYHKPSGAWFLRNTNSAGNADVTFGYGAAGSDWTPVVGDWDGDGRDTIGLYDPATGMFYLRNSLTTGMADAAFPYGAIGAGWTPLIGDWNGDSRASAGFYQSGDASHFYLRNDFAAGMADVHFGLGFAGCLPLVGDWLGPTGQGVEAEQQSGVSGQESGLQIPNPQSLIPLAPQAVDHIDLLTLVEHELGQLAGLDDLPATSSNLMSGLLL